MDLTLKHGHITPDDLESYSMSALPDESAAGVEEHLLVCETCRQSLLDAEQYIAAMKSAAAPSFPRLELAEREKRAKWWRWSFPRLIPAFAALAFLAIAAVTAPLIHHQSALPFAVSLQTMRGVENQAAAPSGQPLLLKLDLTGLTESPVYRIEIVDRSGQRVWQGEFQSIGATGSITAPAQKRGAYFVRVSLPSGETLREYGLQLR